MPASRSSRTGAMPQPSSAFERGQCATATPCSASRAISSSSTVTQCAATVPRRSRPLSARRRIAARPGRRRRARRRTASTAPRRGASRCPRPGSRRGAWRPGRPSSRQARVELRRDRVRRVRRDAEPDAVGERAGDALAVRLEARLELLVGRPEDLEVDDRAQAERVAGARGRADEAAVADRRDPRGQALGGAEPGDRLHVLEADPRLPLDVDQDPRRERQPVAEARVHRVLEVRVRVDEAGEDDGVRVLDAAPELVPRADRRDAAVLDRDRAVADRRPGDRQHPVRREDRAHRRVAARRRIELCRACATVSARGVDCGWCLRLRGRRCRWELRRLRRLAPLPPRPACRCGP